MEKESVRKLTKPVDERSTRNSAGKSHLSAEKWEADVAGVRRAMQNAIGRARKIDLPRGGAADGSV
jgi:hypothetical protein